MKSLPRNKPAICCQPLPDFERLDLGAVRAAFAAATPCRMGQAWRSELETGFAPGVVRTGWRKDALLVFAELTEREVFSQSTGHNQRMWELGDTFEMFFKPAGRQDYVEFHVTPNNQRLQLRFANAEAGTTMAFDRLLLPEDSFQSVT